MPKDSEYNDIALLTKLSLESPLAREYFINKVFNGQIFNKTSVLDRVFVVQGDVIDEGSPPSEDPRFAEAKAWFELMCTMYEQLIYVRLGGGA